MSQHIEYTDLINSYAAFDRENHLDIEPLERTPKARTQTRANLPAGGGETGQTDLTRSHLTWGDLRRTSRP